MIKQARPLEPSPRVSAELRAAPIPHDVLVARATHRDPAAAAVQGSS